MRELPNIIADVRVLLSLEPEELGAKLLFLARRRLDAGDLHQEMLHPQNFMSELWNYGRDGAGYERAQQHAVNQALIEAWAWLEAQGLIVPAAGMNGANGWRVLSRRAKQFENEGQFQAFAVARTLPREALHPAIGEAVWLAFMRGEFDVAVFQATKAVEVAVKKRVIEVPGFEKLLGVDLMRKSFHPETGPLTDLDAPYAERQGRTDLFSGLIGSFKNPQSHRDVNLDDPIEAMEVIMLANHLLRVVDKRPLNG